MKPKAPSILSSDLVVTGSIVSEGEIQLDGVVEGDIRASVLTIGEGASVKGEVAAENVIIRGRVEGSIRARQVELAATAHVEGDVIHAALAIESGAYFDGLCKRDSDPLSEAKSAIAATPGASPSSSVNPVAPSPPRVAAPGKAMAGASSPTKS